MSQAVIHDWTDSQVLLRFDQQRDVRYRVIRDGDTHYQEIQEPDGSPIHVLELPEGMRLEPSSYEVLLRYVLLDVVAAA